MLHNKRMIEEQILNNIIYEDIYKYIHLKHFNVKDEIFQMDFDQSNNEIQISSKKKHFLADIIYEYFIDYIPIINNEELKKLENEIYFYIISQQSELDISEFYNRTHVIQYDIVFNPSTIIELITKHCHISLDSFKYIEWNDNPSLYRSWQKIKLNQDLNESLTVKNNKPKIKI